jgi:acetyl-CoA acetyltransferase
MKKINKKIYMAAGYNTISLGTGRKEFNPKKPMPGIEHYISEAGKGTLSQIGGAKNVDESVIGNFMASRFNNQGHLAGFIPMIDEGLKFKPSIRVEAACASGGMALITGIKSVLAGADTVMALGVEVQNSMKAIYGADVLAGAGWYKKRKAGHAYFFPGQFSDRAGAYFERFGRDKTRRAFARWYRNAIENARLCPTAQEFHNANPDPEGTNLKMEPNGNFFVDNLNVLDCSKVSDGASAIGIFSEEGLAKCGINKKDAVEIVGFATSERDVTKDPEDLTVMETIKDAAHKALANAGITIQDLATIETHDCFTIAGVLAVEALGFAKHGEGADFIAEGNTARNGKIPMNTTGGLVGWGHPTGGTGVHQAVTCWEQLTGKTGDAQINIPAEKPYALSINMGGDDVSVVAIVYRKM